MFKVGDRVEIKSNSWPLTRGTIISISYRNFDTWYEVEYDEKFRYRKRGNTNPQFRAKSLYTVLQRQYQNLSSAILDVVYGMSPSEMNIDRCLPPLDIKN